MWIHREIESTLRAISSKRPSLILTGCRQAGKTSLLKRVFESHNYVTLDIPLAAEEAETSGDDFLKRHPTPLIVDEVQYAPKLLRWIKKDIDERRDENGLFCITGSQKFPLMQRVTESLAGRAAILQCHSLSAREYERWNKRTIEGDVLVEWMFKGGYPELHAKDLDPLSFFSDYIATYLERDVRQVLQVRNLRDFDRFMRLCAARNGQMLSFTSLATDIGISPNTIKSWISVLEASNIIYLLEPYYRNLGKRITKSPKLYFLDTGLASYLLGFRSPADLKQSTVLGALFEASVLGQIIRHFANRGMQAQLYYYRDHHGHEVDFIIPVGDSFKLIECKWAEMPPQKIRGFEEISRLAGEDHIISRSVINPVRGSRQISAGYTLEDSIDLRFLDT